MADPWGIDDGYWTVDGQWIATPDSTRAALRRAMGGGPGDEHPPPPTHPLWFVRAGTGPGLQRPARLVLEDGTDVVATDALPADLPLGYHELHPDDGGPMTELVVVPERASPPPTRAAGLAVQLYAARSRASWGIGDLHDAITLGRWAEQHGIDLLLLSPLHAPLPIRDPDPSPYYPSSRCFRNPLHLRIEDVPGFDTDSPALSALAEAGRALDRERTIDRAQVWALKRAALEHIWERHAEQGVRHDPAFSAWRAAEDPHLTRYATFCALADHHGSGWTAWPAQHRAPSDPAVARFAADHADAVEFHTWVQWLCDRQHRAAGTAGPALLHDLAVGSAPDGADTWLWQDVLATGVRVGAPPDAFNADGQDWGLPPFVPWRLRAAGYEPFVRLLRASFRHAAGLRIDHVMGLFRLWWIPDGAGAGAGGYVRHRGTELADLVALESARAGAFVVGEDLGTVEDEVRAALGERGVLSYRVAWFEDTPPSTWPPMSLASITTHDLPTLAGVATGADDPDGAFGPRLQALVAGTPGAGSTTIAVAAHEALSAARSHVVVATLEDAVGVAERPNVPGTTTEHPNWSRALPVTIEELPGLPVAGAVLDAVTSQFGGQ